MVVPFFDLLEQARGGNLESRQQESFPTFQPQLSPAMEGFLFTAPAFDREAFFRERGLDPITGLPIVPEGPLFSFQQIEDIESSQAGDNSTATPGDNPDGSFLDVLTNVVAPAFSFATVGPLGKVIGLSLGVLNPNATPRQVTNPLNPFSFFDFDDLFDTRDPIDQGTPDFEGPTTDPTSVPDFLDDDLGVGDLDDFDGFDDADPESDSGEDQF